MFNIPDHQEKGKLKLGDYHTLVRMTKKRKEDNKSSHGYWERGVYITAGGSANQHSYFGNDCASS